MATLGIESNGRLEKTAVYYNGEQIGGVKELYLNLDEMGSFDAIIQYEGTDKNTYTKQIFVDHLTNVQTRAPSFTEEDARDLQLLTVESDGDIESTSVFINDDMEDGIVSLFVHIKAGTSPGGIKSMFSLKKELPEHPEFKAEITFRYDDDEVETENIF